MPTYEYRCTTCDTTFDIEQSFSDDPLTRCPIEGGPDACTAPGEGGLKKLFSAVGISFKGSGFYKNDSRSGSSSSSSDSSSSSSDSSSSSSDSSSSSSGSSSSSSGSSSSSSGSSSSSSDSGSAKGSSSSADTS